MATAFHPMNVPLGPRGAQGEPATGGPPGVPLGSPIRADTTMKHEEPGRTTPTRTSFVESNNKRSLPISPDTASFSPLQGTVPRDDRPLSQHDETASKSSKMDDMDMGSDGEEGEGSDAESAEGDGDGRPSKKKKGQRFFCTDYPPCNLSFTRSEHLARHIRKHTGERPFQCHCARRFSRLDNLRQHAQTVHVNEDIPGDSLAATGTRFQRQIRTDRVRPQGRARASTGGSQSSHRGHGRNLSTSSITSIGSNASTLSNLSSLGYDTGRRPQPLMMAETSPRRGLTIDTSSTASHGGYPAYGGHSPNGSATTPTYSNTPSSPFNPGLGSPVNVARHQPWGGDRGHNRRLSVPSAANPFQPAGAGVPGGGYHMSPLHPTNHSRTSSTNSIVTSPTNSVHSFTRPDSAEDADWRRRTWHPGGYPGYSYQRPATSGLAYQQTPDAPRPGFAPQPAVAASQSQRLPGFETFDQISQRPATPPRRPAAAPGTAEAARQPAFSGPAERTTPDRRGHLSWDMSLHQNLTKLDIANGTPPRETAPGWNRRPDAPQHSSYSGQVPVQAPAPPVQHSHESIRAPAVSFESQGEPSTQTSARAKRQGWYHAPPQDLRPAQPQNVSEPPSIIARGSHPIGPADAHTSHSNGSAPPHVAHSNSNSFAFRPAQEPRAIDERRGYPQSPPQTHPHPHPHHHPQPPSGPHPPPYDPARQPLSPTEHKSHRMTGLEALVAAATGEEKSRDEPMR